MRFKLALKGRINNAYMEINCANGNEGFEALSLSIFLVVTLLSQFLMYNKARLSGCWGQLWARNQNVNELFSPPPPLLSLY